MIDLSIILVNWKVKEYLLECIQSIPQTEGPPSIEVIVVDNGSRDGCVDALRMDFPWCRLIENERNLGFAKAANQGIRESKGRYLLLLNPDTTVKGQALERLVAFMDLRPEAAVGGAQLLNPDGSRQNSIAPFPSLATELLNKSLLRWLFPGRFPGKERTCPGPVEVDSVIGAAMIVRREAVDRVGLLDEDYFLFFEETDWCYRMRDAGWKIYHLPQAEICHSQGRSARADKKRARVEYYRSRYLFFKKNRGGFQWLVLHIGLGIRLSAELASAGLGCLLTLGALKRWNRKLLLFAYLTWWHLRGCPSGMGLKGKDSGAISKTGG
jgi:GT2 family glycosyltransferase